MKDRLDFDDDLLAELDVVVASLHVPSNNEADNTKRLLRAAENTYVHMLGHLSGRLLLEREAYPVNQQAVIDACARDGHVDRAELQPAPVRSRLAALAVREEARESSASSTRTRTATSTPAFLTPGRRHRPQGLAREGGRDQHVADGQAAEGTQKETRPLTDTL